MTVRRVNTPPTVIHRYPIVDRIGQGGMGALYLARDPLLGRLVAIKVLREGFGNGRRLTAGVAHRRHGDRLHFGLVETAFHLK
jgi:hypothetical protein